MLDIENILAQWDKDSVIDSLELDSASINSAKLHAKYLEMISITRLEIKRNENKLNTLLKNKYLWYNGKLNKEEMDNLGWSYDPLDGLKIMKGDMDLFYNSDSDIMTAKSKIDYLKNTEHTLKEILDNIRWRAQNIKNIITWRQFTSGS